MTTSTNDRPRSRRTKTLLVGGLASTALLSTLLVGCSASDSADSAGMATDHDAAAPAAAAEDGAAGAAGGERDVAAASAPDERQVVQTGDVSLRAKDALKATAAVVTHVERVGGRVDDRSEQAGSRDSSASATLVVRVPAAKVTSTIDVLRGLGTVDSVDLQATDVTGAAEDLDARIHALELSIARMDALLAKATTSKDIIDAEGALTERQSSLEKLQSERAHLADQVSLSTLTVHVYGPDVAPPVRADGPGSFFAGIAVGWDSFVSAAKAVVIVLGVLLPWLAFAGAVVAGVIALNRARRRSARPPAATAAPSTTTPAPEGPTTPGASA